MWGAIGEFIVWIAGLVARLFSSQVARWVIFKALVQLVVITILPVVLINVYNSILVSRFNALTSNSGSASSLTVQFVGLAGWLASQLMVPQAFAIIISAVAVRFTFRLISGARL
ncbi:MAG: hypothetical protein M0033_10100 [Nitrospiraceae bacterium]|nr:hypothetical protein [Nitrospiraceae bacterium]